MLCIAKVFSKITFFPVMILYIEVEKQVHRLWANMKVLKNSKKIIPKIDSFQVSFKNICLFSKLKAGNFPKNHNITTMILGILKQERNIQKLRVILRKNDCDFYSLIMRHSQNNWEKLSLKRVIFCFENMDLPHKKSQTLIRFKKTRQKSTKKKKYRKSINFNSRNSNQQEEESENESVSLRINTQSSLMDMQKNQINIKNTFKPRNSDFLKENSKLRKHKKYTYLSKQMDIDVVLQQEKGNLENMILDELTEDDEKEKNNKMKKERKKMKKLFSNKKRSYLRVQEAQRERKLSQKNKNQNYQVNINWAHDNQSQKSKQSSIKSIMPPSERSIFLSKKQIETALATNQKKFKINKNDIKQEFEMVNLCDFVKSENLDYIIQKNNRILISSEKNSLQNIMMYLSENFPFEIRRIFNVDFQSMKRKNYFQHYSPILFNKNLGQFEVIVVSNEFPLEIESDEFVYQNPVHSQCWPMILEKALAKIYGSYKKLYDQGTTDDFIKILTGNPLIQIKTSDHAKMKKVVLFDYFYAENRKGRAICVGKNRKNNNVAFYFPQIIQFINETNNIQDSIIKIKLSDYLTETLTYESFEKAYEAVILWFHEENYIHNQLRMKYQPKKIWLNGREDVEKGCKLAWKVLMFAENKVHTFIQFNEGQKSDKKTSINILKMVEKDDTEEEIPSNHSLKSRTETKQKEEQKKMLKFKSQKEVPKYYSKNFELVGSIKKAKSFFFEVQLQPGHYVCEIQRMMHPKEENILHTYSNQQIIFKDSMISNEKVIGLSKKGKLYFKLS